MCLIEISVVNHGLLIVKKNITYRFPKSVCY
nr:MAG TPA: hypothetical protein [Caudoviricetes sp.]